LKNQRDFMIEPQTFRAVIEEGSHGGAYVTIPFDVEKLYGQKRVPVKAFIDSEPYRGSLVRMGGPAHILGILRGIRDKIGKDIGDEVEIILEHDIEPRRVTVPADLKAALVGEPEAETAFTQLSYTHRKEYVQWIEEAKRPATRVERINKTIAMLKKG